MIESYENALQFAVALVCLCVSIGRAMRTRERAWILLSAFYACWTLGDLYWEIFLIFLHITPPYFYVADFSWYASYLLLFLLLRQLLPPEAWRGRRLLPWIGPVFAVAMCAFYLQFGDVASNLVCMALMALLLYHAIRGLLFLRGAADRRQTLLCAAVLVFCAMEYLTWTVSCFWKDDSLTNPYYLADTLLTLSFIPLLPGVGKAVRA